MRDLLTVFIGKTVRAVARLRGGGSALPGLVIERIDPGFMKRQLMRLPHGVVAVSGTNGKTTTTKMIVELLEAEGFTVFTNKTGSNFSRGVVAALLQHCSIWGKLTADIALLELDEAHAMSFIQQVKPRYTLLLNVLRDQLDRFGEIDVTAGLLSRLADATTDGLVVNATDPFIASIGEGASSRLSVSGFGLSTQLLAQFPSDAEMYAGGTTTVVNDHQSFPIDVRLVDAGTDTASFQFGESDGIATSETHTTKLSLSGLYNMFNAAAALAMVRMISQREATTSQTSSAKHTLTSTELLTVLSKIQPAFGRGEKLVINGQPLELVLVKNPAGFRLALASYPADCAVMIAINDQYADGRDMSWLWDVDFHSLLDQTVSVVSGSRAYDMALRLDHDGVHVAEVIPELEKALDAFISSAPQNAKRIYCNYTAMLSLRSYLASKTQVQQVW